VAIKVNDIQWDNKRHVIMIGKTTIALTATEYRLLCPLRHGTPVTYADLALIAYNYRLDEKMRTMMDKHIDRIRGKLRGTGIYVYCVLNYGYLLLPEVLPCEVCGKPERF
jgi:DNA-binding response OmpR family regulator